MTKEDLIKNGWVEFKSDNRTDLKRSMALYKKENYFLIFYNRDKDPFPTIRMGAEDPIKETWTLWPERFSIMIPCPTIELLNAIYDALIQGKQEINMYD